ncbi:hypothetical protein M758_3G147800 [Ceratodon purpureus]|nr:hypothetical protein M758_3G147800 [Ceratodon purpureus]
MDSHEEHVEFDSAGCQQTRLSGFYRNVHSKFSPHAKKGAKVEDVVIASQVVRKKPRLVIGDFTDSVAQPECGDRSGPLDGLPTPQLPASVRCNENVVDSTTGLAIGPERDSVLSNPSSDTFADYSNAKKPNAGAGTKRKATKSEDVMNKKRDVRIREVPSPIIPNTKSGTSIEPKSRSNEKVAKGRVLVKKAVWKQDSDCTYDSPTTPDVPVPPLKESSRVKSANDVIVQQNRNRVQAPPSGTSILPSDRSSPDGPLCQMEERREDMHSGKISKEGPYNDPSTEVSNSSDEAAIQKCSTTGRRLRKDVFLGENWGLPVDLKGTLFVSKMKEILRKPFDSKELSEMWDFVNERKPVLKLRQTRGRTMHVPSKDEGLSYLDHHPDLAQKIEDSCHPATKLALLRAFYFWLQHSCMEGAFKPWAPERKTYTPEGDCELTDGPDCEVLAVVLDLDETNEKSNVVKPLEPVIINLSDDDEDDCVEITVKPPVTTAPNMNFCENYQTTASCIFCLKEFGMERNRQRALYRTCGHIETCMQCVDRLWNNMDKYSCLRCGVIQSMKPGSLFEFADTAE